MGDQLAPTSPALSRLHEKLEPTKQLPVEIQLIIQELPILKNLRVFEICYIPNFRFSLEPGNRFFYRGINKGHTEIDMLFGLDTH